MAELIYYFKDDYTDATGSYIKVPYTVKYSSTTNQTTVTFGQGYLRAFGSGGTTIFWKIYATAKAVDNNDEGKATYAQEQPNYEGREFFYVDPNSSSVTVKHSNTIGKKKVKITVDGHKWAGREGGPDLDTGSAVSVTIEVGTYSYGAVGKPSNIKVYIDSKEVTKDIDAYRDSQLKISWTKADDGTNNPVAGYKLIYTSGSTQKTLSVGNVTEYSFKIMNQFGAPTKGTTFTLGVQALATSGGLDSSVVTSSKNITIVNKPPEPPTFTTSGVLRCNKENDVFVSCYITINNLAAVDVDGDEVEYKYFCSNDEEFEEDSKSPILLETNKISMTANKPHLYISAVEKRSGLAGNYTKKNVSVNTIPKWKPSYQPGSVINNYIGSLNNLSYTLENQTSKIVSWQWQAGDEAGHKTNLSEEQNPSVVSLKPDVVEEAGGKEIILYLTVTDAAGDTFKFSHNTGYLRLETLTPSTLTLMPQQNPGKAGDSYIGENIKVEVDFSRQPGINEVDRRIEFYKMIDSTTWGEKIGTRTIKAQKSTQTFENIDSKASEKTYQLGVKITDAFGYEAGEEKSIEYKVLNKLNMGKISFNPQEWHPLVDVTTSKATFTVPYSASTNGSGENLYELRAHYGGNDLAKAVQLFKPTLLSDLSKNTKQVFSCVVSGDTAKISVNQLDLYKCIKGTSTDPTTTVTFFIIGYNAFGETDGTAQPYSTKVIAREAPILDKGTIEIQILGENNNTDKKKRVHIGEEITFSINGAPTSPNDDYYIEKGVEEAPGKTINHFGLYYRHEADADWTLYENYDFIENDKYKTSFSITLALPNSTEAKAKPTWFAIRLFKKDSHGTLYSDYYPTEELELCRRVAPKFSITDASFSEGDVTVNLKSTDLGGNNYGADNFFRMGDETYKIEYMFSDENFKDDNWKELESSVTEPPATEPPETEPSNPWLNKSLKLDKKGEWNFSFTSPLGNASSRVYIKARIIITTNSETSSTIIGESQTYLLYLNSPTLAHRAHWVGINTTRNDQGDVFHVTSFDEKGIIRLEGADGVTKETIEVLIDLNTGKMINEKSGLNIDFKTGKMYIDKENGLNIDLSAGIVENALISGGSW